MEKSRGGALTVKETVACFVCPPPVPVTVTVYVPEAVFGEDASVSVDAYGGKPVDGFSVAVMPDG
jgi:hypothetical protein